MRIRITVNQRHRIWCQVPLKYFTLLQYFQSFQFMHTIFPPLSWLRLWRPPEHFCQVFEVLDVFNFLTSAGGATSAVSSSSVCAEPEKETYLSLLIFFFEKYFCSSWAIWTLSSSLPSSGPLPHPFAPLSSLSLRNLFLNSNNWGRFLHLKILSTFAAAKKFLYAAGLLLLLSFHCVGELWKKIYMLLYFILPHPHPSPLYP